MRHLAFLAGLALSASASAATCPNAIDLTGSTTGDNTGATELYAHSCGFNATTDVAYEFVAAADGDYVFDTEGTTGMGDTVIALFDTASVDCATQIACDDDGGTGFLSSIQTSLLTGESTLVVFSGFNGSEGAFNLNVTFIPVGGICGDGFVTTPEECDDGNLIDGDGCEANCTITPPACGNGLLETGEDCDDGNLINGDGCEDTCTVTPQVCGEDADLGSALGFGLFVGSTVGGLNDFDGASCGGGQAEADLAFLWTAPYDGNFYVDSNGSAFDTALTIQDLTCTELYCDDDGGASVQSKIFFTAAAGDQFYIVADGFGSGPGGDYVLSINDNDLCPDADDDGVCDPITFNLEITQPIPGQPMTFTATNAIPNSNVFFFVSGTNTAPDLCHPTYTTECTNLGPAPGSNLPRTVARVRADASGFAEATITAPASLPSGFTVYAQAFSLSSSAGEISNETSDVSP